MAQRARVAAVIERDGQVLMVRERTRGASDRHDGPEYWTLPGGGIEPGESSRDAVAREVLEEVGLIVIAASEVAQLAYSSGPTTVFRVEVAPGEPRLGEDELPCPCPRMVGLDWVRVPAVSSPQGGSPVPLLIYSC